MAKTKTRTTTKTSGADLLAQLAGTTKPKASKSNTPIVVVTDDAEVKQLIDICEQKGKEKAAKQKSAMAQDKLRPAAVKKWEAQCQADKTLHSSVKLTADVDGVTHSLTLTQKKMCKQMIESEVSDELQTIFGDDYDDHFAAERTITIDTGVLDDEAITAVILAVQKALKFADDPATYRAAVGVTAAVVPNEAFFRDRVLDADFRNLACRAERDGLAVPHAASFKL